MLVSVIIPCYNAEFFLEECVESVLAQTYSQLEIIIVDNGSTDSTLSLAFALSKKHSNVEMFQVRKKGAPFARNKGLKEAKGDWIQFLDADDLLAPEKIEHQIGLIDKKVSFVAGAFCYESDGKKKILKPWKDPFMGLMHGSGAGYTCSNLWNKACLLKIGGWNEALEDTQDPDLIFRMLKENQKVILDAAVYTTYRDINSSSISKENYQRRYLNNVKLRSEIITYLQQFNKRYFREREPFFRNTLYNYIRYLTFFDYRKGTDAYVKYLPKGFVPYNSNEAIVPVWNRMMVRMMGFKKTELVLKWVKKILGQFRVINK